MRTRPVQSSATVSGTGISASRPRSTWSSFTPTWAPIRLALPSAPTTARASTRLAALQDHGDRAPVRHRRAVLLDARNRDARAQLGARLLGVLDELLRRTRAG